MPVSVVTNDTEEHKWERAKQIAKDEGHEGDWKYVMGIYKRMNPKRFKKASFDIKTIEDLYNLANDHGKGVFTTHDGKFHADDVASVALASRLFGTSNNVNIIRTRDPKKFRGLIMDVGEGQFDHHGAAHTFTNGIPDSSFSKIYNIMKTKLSPEEQIYLQRRLIDPVSKIDNGIRLDKGEESLFTWVPGFNSNYLERRKYTQDNKFRKAVRLAEEIIDRELENARADAKASKPRNKILAKAKKDAIVDVPDNLDIFYKDLANSKAKFTITKKDDGTYHLKTVAKKKGDEFSKKVPFPKEWAGKKGKELQLVSGFPDATFSHSERFLTGFKTRDSAMRAAKLLLKQYKK